MILVFFWQLGNARAENSDNTSIATKVLNSYGPFVTVRLAQSVFSGHKRPAAAVISDVMDNLAKDGLGTTMTVEKTRVFYKKLPCNVQGEALEAYGVGREDYTTKFTERAPIAQISKELFNKLLEKAPKKDDLETVYTITAEE